MLFKAITLVGVGAVAASLPLLAARRRRVVPDPAVDAVLALLPGANCGLCGSASCFAAAQGIVSGRLPYDTCVTGGAEVAAAVRALSVTRASR